MTDTLTSISLDIPATILRFADAEVPDSLPGISLKGFSLGGIMEKDRDFVVAETTFALGTRHLGLVGRMARTRRYKYCVYDVGGQREQLFDMESDPGETQNLAVDPNYVEELNKHRALIATWAQQTSDNNFPYVSENSKLPISRIQTKGPRLGHRVNRNDVSIPIHP